MGKIIIDCDAMPPTDRDWEFWPSDQLPGVVEGQLEFDPAKIILHLDEGQKDNRKIEGYELKRKLAGRALLKINVLHYLLDNPHLIPKSWEGDEQGRISHIYFWGSIFRGIGLNERVPYLYRQTWDRWEDEWQCKSRGLDHEFNRWDPAAILVG